MLRLRSSTPSAATSARVTFPVPVLGSRDYPCSRRVPFPSSTAAVEMITSGRSSTARIVRVERTLRISWRDHADGAKTLPNDVISVLCRPSSTAKKTNVLYDAHIARSCGCWLLAGAEAPPTPLSTTAFTAFSLTESSHALRQRPRSACRRYLGRVCGGAAAARINSHRDARHEVDVCRSRRVGRSVSVNIFSARPRRDATGQRGDRPVPAAAPARSRSQLGPHMFVGPSPSTVAAIVPVFASDSPLLPACHPFASTDTACNAKCSCTPFITRSSSSSARTTCPSLGPEISRSVH